MSPELWMLTAALFGLGLIFGSFFNVVGLRVPLGKSVVHPPSSCSHCGKRLVPVDLIPVFGWLLRKGKCRHCGEAISSVYLLGELAAGLLFAWLPFIAHGPELGLLYLFSAVIVVVSVADLRYRMIPNKIIYPSMLLFAVARLWVHDLPLWQYYAGFLAGGGVLLAVSWVGERMGKSAMGGGDVKMMALMGLVLGIKLLLLCVFLSALLGSVMGIILILSKRLGRNEFLPYGPFIGAASLLAAAYGNSWIAWYGDLLIY